MFLWKMVHVVITDDSDLLVFGVHRVFFKMDTGGKGYEIDLGKDYEKLKKVWKPIVDLHEFTKQ